MVTIMDSIFFHSFIQTCNYDYNYLADLDSKVPLYMKVNYALLINPHFLIAIIDSVFFHCHSFELG